MRLFISLFITMAILFCLSNAQAEVVRGLNTVTVPVNNRSQEALQKVLPMAMGRALVKISGNPGVATLPAIQNSLTHAGQLLRSYGFHEKTNDQMQPQLYVQVTFDRHGLDRILRQAGQPIWRDNRPLALVWLTVDTNQSSYVLSSSANNKIKMDLSDSAKQRAVPILLPTMDLRDESYINTNQAQAFNRTNLMAAAKRYEVNIVLAGNIGMDANNQWVGQWLLLLNGEPFRWNDTGDSDKAVIAAAVNKFVNMMAGQYAVIDNQDMQDSVTLEVMGVNSIDEYAKVVKVLRRLTPVASVSVRDFTDNGVLINVKTVGGVQALAQALNTNRQFTAIPGGLNTGSAQANLYYQWGA